MEPIPITILGGSDRKRSRLPDRARGMHPLGAYKGAALCLDGEPLALVLARRLLASGGFGPVTIAGPDRIYGPRILERWGADEPGPAPVVIDTDSTVAMNLKAAIRHHEATHEGPLAILACDVLPTVDELADLRARFEEARPVGLWLPFIQSPPDPDELGAFAWKPKYRIVPADTKDGTDAVPILPGHLGIFKPERLRVRLLFNLMDAAYRTRNRPVASRRWAMLWRVSGSLLLADLLRLLRLHPPTRTVAVVRAGLRISAALRSKELRAADLERIVGDVFLHHEYRRLPRPICLPILRTLSLAEDVDTEEEAADLMAEVLDDAELGPLDDEPEADRGAPDGRDGASGGSRTEGPAGRPAGESGGRSVDDSDDADPPAREPGA